MRKAKVKGYGIGALFDVYGELGRSTVFHLSRPLDIAPTSGTRYDVPALGALVAQAAGWLAAAGAKAGDRIAIIKDNHWDCTLLACAAARLGALPAMISATVAPAYLEELLRRLEPAVTVTQERLLSACREAGVDPTKLSRAVVSLDGQVPGTLSLTDLPKDQSPPPQRRDPSAPMIVTHTSGTTGVPKLVVHSCDTILGILGKVESVRWPIVATRRSDTVASAISFVHGRSIPWTAGTLILEPRKAVIVADGDPAVAERVLSAHRPTTCEALPSTFTRWERLAQAPHNVFSDVRLYVSTFDAMHPPTIRTFLAASRRRMPVWLQGWGQSEAGPLAFRLLTRRALARTGERHPTTRQVGRPLPGFTRLKVVDPQTMRPLEAGERGLVLARTRGRCLTYLGEEDRWREKARGQWWNTGDIGVRSRTGNVSLLDREVDSIPGMSCIELEDVLTDRIPRIEEVVILGSPGREPLPVVCTPDGTLDAAEWRRATGDLPPLAEPVCVTWDEVPRTGTGKVRRGELRARFLDGAATHGTGRWT
ncbi:AMP-binding protein [Streptomyces sp. Go-475]|uniref:class I adenylate-forming enzyme family protein n=1 Tax=Streptomyces sp. Go-475 TaxID=2072505 RepID=UPI000DF06FD6|nr:AMP-binding protein [Streptomyces sp. Go-475]AXE88777.1 Long-chain-fatty-acid--CoA ligase [Streptomyces sp. Go-475]